MPCLARSWPSSLVPFLPTPLWVVEENPSRGSIVPAFVVRKADLTLGHPEGVLHVPAAEGHPHQGLQLGVGLGIGQEILLLARLGVPGPDQPVGPVAPAPLLHLPELRRF